MAVRFANAQDTESVRLEVDASRLRYLSLRDVREVQQLGYVIKEPSFFESLGSASSAAPSSPTGPCSSPSACAPLALDFVALLRECERMFESGGAAQSAHMAHYTDSRVRGDSLVWLHRVPDLAERFPLLERCMHALSRLIGDLEHACAGFRCVRAETQLAMYPVGAHYVRHLDANPWRKDGVTRRLTLLLYLNPNWEVAHGGQLRLFDVRQASVACAHPPTEPAEECRNLDVLPLAGRMVLFQSARVEHEVLIAEKRRFAITTWLYERTDG
jgi:SM-20-related protein